MSAAVDAGDELTSFPDTGFRLSFARWRYKGRGGIPSPTKKFWGEIVVSFKPAAVLTSFLRQQGIAQNKDKKRRASEYSWFQELRMEDPGFLQRKLFVPGNETPTAGHGDNHQC